MNGILLIDKPAGITSHGVISKLRKKLGTKKIGHAGTLDPTATGLLIMCIGQATKISSYVTESEKKYETDIEFGKTTTTYDSEGEFVEIKDASKIKIQDIQKHIQTLLGEQKQKPPMYSAVKIGGKKLYEYARAEKEIEIPDRDVTIHSIEMTKFENPKATLSIHCSKGTYVRSIVHDLGQLLHVGAYVETIRRTQSGQFNISDALMLDDILLMNIEDIRQKMISISDVLSNSFHTIQVDEKDEEKLSHGMEFPKYKVTETNFEPNHMFLFVSASKKSEIAIGQWGLSDRIEIKRVF